MINVIMSVDILGRQFQVAGHIHQTYP